MSYDNQDKSKHPVDIIRSKHAELLVAGDYEQMSQLASERILAEIRRQPNLLIGIATGSTPALAYDLLAEQGRSDPSLFEQVRLMGLDEWGGVPNDDPCTCQTYIEEHLIKPLSIPAERYTLWNSQPVSPEAEVERIKQIISKQGDLDLCILGMGVNGHLGFNEPAAALKLKPHVATLAASTKQHSMAQAAEHEIGYGSMTLGMGEIMRSRKIILVINGAHKVEPCRRFFTQEISDEFPASLLWLHPNLTIICDREAVPVTPKEL